jgi:hypothetical protein
MPVLQEIDAAAKARIAELEATTGGVHTHLGPSLEMFIVQCGHCHKEQGNQTTFSSCAACRSVVYCSRECQKNHWAAGHKRLCRKPQPAAAAGGDSTAQ